MRHRILIQIIVLVSFALGMNAQNRFPNRYSTTGLDMELLSYGGSFGGFYSIHPTEAFSFDFESDWTLVESNDTFTYLNVYNQPVSINNRNLSFVKGLAGVTWFPFLETMHPSFQFGVFAGIGPLISLNTADDQKFLERWQAVDVDVTTLGRAGVHIRVLTGQGSAYNFKLGYDYSHFDKIIDERQTYQGIFFQAAWEFVHR